MVVLPAPFGPMIRRRSPGMTWNETSLVAGRPPKCLFRPMTSSAGVAHAAGSDAALRSGAPAIPSALQPPPQLLAAGNEAVRHEYDHDHEDGAEQRVPAFDIGADHVLDERDDQRADDRTGERRGAAEDRHQQDFGRLLQGERMRAEKQVVVDEEHACDRAPEAGHDECEQLNEPHVVPEHSHAPRLILGAHEARAERRTRKSPEEEKRDREHDQGEIVEACGIPDIEAERHGPGGIRDAVVAAGERIRAIGDPPHDLSDRERDHDESEAGRAQRQARRTGRRTRSRTAPRSRRTSIGHSPR